MSNLLISVRFHDGRYHGSGGWPPSPARLFQALVAGAARGGNLSQHEVVAFEWLESLDAPLIAVPSAYAGQVLKNYVPNNDRDVVEAKRLRGALESEADYQKALAKQRTGKIVRAHIFDASIPLLYTWAFEPSADAERHARAICEIAEKLYQLGRGVDMAWATGEVVDGVYARLRATGGVLWRPNLGGSGTELSCPRVGSFMSLTNRFKAMRKRLKTVEAGKKIGQLFVQAPKPHFRQVPYNSPSEFLLFEIRNAEGFIPQPLERVAALTEQVRDLAARRLIESAWLQHDPKRETLAEKIFIGRDAQEADKARRISIVPLPSIGHTQADRSIRRVLVVVPPDCCIATGDIAWTFSGLVLKSDGETGEILQELVQAEDCTMLGHYGIESEEEFRLWRTVTPAAFPERAARRRIDPRRMHEEAKGGAERVREHGAAEWAVLQALRHTGVDAYVRAIRVQREPFEGKGLRAEAFAKGTRFAKERLWHVEVGFASPIAGPILIGDGRYLGLGLMRPAQRMDGIFAFTITDGLMEPAEPLGLTRALRRAVMPRVQKNVGPRATLPAFFTGHASDGAPLRSGRHEHLAFVFDAPRRRLMILAPHILDRREASKRERGQYLPRLAESLEDFQELRSGAAGKLALISDPVDQSDDPLFGRSPIWESLTPYRVTRHARLNDAAAALETDLTAECRRAGLPRPQIEVFETFGKPGLGLFGRVRLTFHAAVPGPLLLGRDRHFGGGLFVAGA